MIDRIDYRHLAIRYVFAEARAFTRSPRPGDQALEYATRIEARCVLEAMAHREPALLDRLCRALDGVGWGAHGRHRHPIDAGDPRVDHVLRALGPERLSAERGEAPRLAGVYLLRESKQRRSLSAPQTPEAGAIDRAISRLGSDVLLFRGDSYRVVRAGAVAAVANRDRFEALSAAELIAVLKACTAAPECPDVQKSALVELLSLAEAQRGKNGHTEVVLLRRQRLQTTSVDAGPAVTPSGLRAARERDWIGVEAVDKDERPVAGVRLEFVLPGGTSTLITDATGVARLASVSPGNVTIRVTGLDGEVWRPVGGAGASPAGELPAPTYVVRDGDCLTKIAARHGFKGWQKLWEHPQNEALRKRRRSPHVLAPGDVVALPRLTIKELVRQTGAVHRIEVQRPSALVRLRLQDMAGNPLAGVSYQYGFRSEEGSVRRPGTQATDADGWLAESVPLFVRQLEVDVRLPRLRFVFDLRRLHPARDGDTDTPIASGVAERLARLGYRAGRSEGAATKQAGDVTLFQALHLRREDPKGEPDRETLDALEGAYTV